MTTLRTTSSATASDRPPAQQVQIADGCGGTPLSAWAIRALAQYGPVWLWRQAIKPMTRN